MDINLQILFGLFYRSFDGLFKFEYVIFMILDVVIQIWIYCCLICYYYLNLFVPLYVIFI